MKILFIFLLAPLYTFSQKLHHQMLCSQGGKATVQSGKIVKYTVGQQTVSGTNTGNVIVQQGFQQSNKMKPVATPAIVINTKTYPNPFIDKVNFQFSSPVEGPIKISLFDILGRLVFSAQKYPTNNIVTIDNLFFPEGEYFAKLTANNFTYTTNLLKSK